MISTIPDKRELLNQIAKKHFGLALLHGHNNEAPFTKLPEGYVAVIANGETSFRSEADVLADQNFVPNTWRSINGQLRVAGGFSKD